MPRVGYWNAGMGEWVTYDEATRYDHTPTDLPEGETDGSTVAVVDALGVDMAGYFWRMDEHLGPVRMTSCCAAATSIMDGPLYCKSCYNAVPWEIEADPVLGPLVAVHHVATTGPVWVTLR